MSEFEFQACQVLASLVHAEGLLGGVDLRRQARDLLLDGPSPGDVLLPELLEFVLRGKLGSRVRMYKWFQVELARFVSFPSLALARSLRRLKSPQIDVKAETWN